MSLASQLLSRGGHMPCCCNPSDTSSSATAATTPANSHRPVLSVLHISRNLSQGYHHVPVSQAPALSVATETPLFTPVCLPMDRWQMRTHRLPQYSTYEMPVAHRQGSEANSQARSESNTSHHRLVKADSAAVSRHRGVPGRSQFAPSYPFIRTHVPDISAGAGHKDRQHLGPENASRDASSRRWKARAAAGLL